MAFKTPEPIIDAAQKPQSKYNFVDSQNIGLTQHPSGKITLEDALHEGFKRAIPGDKITEVLSKRFNLQPEQVKKYVDENTIKFDDKWIDLDDWLNQYEGDK